MFPSVRVALWRLGSEPRKSFTRKCRMATDTAFYQTGIVKDYKFGIMSCGRRPKPFRSLMELRIELLELFGKRFLQLARLIWRKVLLHDVTSA